MIFTQKDASRIYTKSSLILSGNLEESELALKYLKKRGFQKETIENNLIGFTHLTDDKRFLYSQLRETYSALDILNSKLARVSPEGEVTDFFGKGRIVFPVYEKGVVIGMIGRSILPSCFLRYKTLQFEEKMIFNLDCLSYDPQRIYLVEGIIDALSLIEVGIPALGILGTTNFGVETANKLKHYCGDIICLFDTDENKSGQKGRNRLLSILYSIGLRKLFYKELPLHKGKKSDINDLFVSLDREEFRTMIESLELQEFTSVQVVTSKPFSRKGGDIPILPIVQANMSIKQESEYRFRGTCPFHVDSVPSFIINTDANRFHCFGCGERGNTLDFFRKINNLDEKETYKKLINSFVAGEGEKK